MTPLLTPGAEVRLLAELRGISARDLARRSGIAYPRTRRILNGEGKPTADELADLRMVIFAEDPEPAGRGRGLVAA